MFTPKVFDQQKFVTSKIFDFDPRTILTPKIFWHYTIFDPKNMLTQTFLNSTNLPPKYLDP
jgi:hypothetical protein